MRRAVVLLLVAATACTTPAVTPQTSAVVDPTTTLATPATTSTVPIPMEIQGCTAPPVTFSTLCETIELLEEWHVDRPVDIAHLADLAIAAAGAYESDELEEPARTFFCAIPDPAFTPFCDLLHERVQEEGIAVGPIVEAAVTSMVDLGLDPFTWYIPPELAAGFRPDGVVGGVGILLDATDAAGSKCARIADVCPLRIVFVLEGNPGAAAGLMTGDVITTVDGLTVEGKGFVEASTLIGGDQTGEVALGIERDGRTIEIVVERSELDLPRTTVEVPIDGVGYIRIPDFSAEVPFIVDTALAALDAAGPDTIVIDLRDNPGGLVDAAVSVASQFISDGTILHYTGPDGPSSYPAHGGGPKRSQRLVVLVNGGTASSAEILAGALRDRLGATLVGQPTYGKNALQIPFELRNGGEFHVAIARWTTPGGFSVGDGGLIPDSMVEFPPDPTTEELTRFAIESS